MAYLDRVPAAVRSLAAARTDAAQWRTLAVWAASGAILILLSASGLPRRTLDWLARRTSRPWLAGLAATVVFMAAFEGLRLTAVWFAARTWPEGAPGQSFAHTLSALPVHVLVGATALSLLLWGVRAAPRRGWIVASAAAAGVIFCLLLIPPLASLPAARQDAPAYGGATASILAFVHKGGLEAERLYVFDSADSFDVDMEGLGPFTHAAVSRAVLAAPRPEAFAAMGHLLGHYRHGDLWSLALLVSGFAAVFFFAVWKIDGPGKAGGANGPAAVALLAWAVLSLAAPAFNAFDQAINYRADDYAMGLTRDPDALCRWLIATETERKADPSPLERLLFYSHPPLATRLENAMRWKAAHGL